MVAGHKVGVVCHRMHLHTSGLPAQITYVLQNTLPYKEYWNAYPFIVCVCLRHCYSHTELSAHTCMHGVGNEVAKHGARYIP